MGWYALPLRKCGMALVLPCLLVVTLLTLVGVTSQAVVGAQPVQARGVQGVLRGGQSAQIWLSLTPEFADAQIKVIAEWDRLFPAANGLNFFIFDEQQLRRLDDGRTSFSALALAAGSPHFELATPDSAIGAGFNATGWASYALVLVNESAADATFTLHVTNAFVSDSAAQVTALDQTALSLPLPTLTPTVLPPTAFLTTPGFISTTTFFTTGALAPSTAPVPVTAVVTTTGAAVAPATSTYTSTAPSLTVAPRARTGLGQPKGLISVRGVLATRTTQQILRLQPTKVQGQVLLRLLAEEQGDATPQTTDTLNFWVFDEAGFSQYLTGAAPNSVAMSAGKPVFRGPTNERAAGFRSTTLQPYTVVIYSATTQSVTYTLRVEGAQILENFYLP